MNKTQTQKPEKRGKSEGLFCVVNDAFRVFARKSSVILGSAWTFILALFIIAVWAVTGPAFHFSDTWQLVINTGTTIVTFMMVFIIQNTQNRDAKAVHLKLDEIIRAIKGARNELVDLEEMSEADLKKLEEEFKHLHDHAEAKLDHVAKARAARSKMQTFSSS